MQMGRQSLLHPMSHTAKLTAATPLMASQTLQTVMLSQSLQKHHMRTILAKVTVLCSRDLPGQHFLNVKETIVCQCHQKRNEIIHEPVKRVVVYWACAVPQCRLVNPPVTGIWMLADICQWHNGDLQPHKC